MTRPWIGVVWVTTIVATWLIVRSASTERTDPPITTPVAPPRGRVLQADRPSLPAVREAKVEREVTDDSTFRTVLATLERDLADGRWSIADRDRFNRSLPTVTRPQAEALYDVLIPKLNEGTVISDIDGPPL